MLLCSFVAAWHMVAVGMRSEGAPIQNPSGVLLDCFISFRYFQSQQLLGYFGSHVDEKERARSDDRANGPERPWLSLSVRQKMNPDTIVCEKCRQKEATVHVRSVVSSHRVARQLRPEEIEALKRFQADIPEIPPGQMNLCDDCAIALRIIPPSI
jgi:hypothetical protein